MFLRRSLCPARFNEDKLNQFLELSQGDHNIEEYHWSPSFFPSYGDEATLLNIFVRKLNLTLVKNAKPSFVAVSDAVAMAEDFAKEFCKLFMMCAKHRGFNTE